MPNDWTSSETISSPDQITINWKVRPAGSTTVVDKSVKLQSTTKSTSKTEYQTFAYNDAEGKLQTQDVAVFKRDVKTATIASVNSAYVTYRVQNGLGLPSGNAGNVSETTTEYAITVEGPVKIRETTVDLISFVQFAGSLAVPSYKGYAPGTYLIVSNKTIIEYQNIKTVTGRDMTRTFTSRWQARGLTQEGSQAAKEDLLKADEIPPPAGSTNNAELFDVIILSFLPLVFEGTEVQTSTGREPVPARPSEQDSIKDEVVNGDTNPDDTTVTTEEKYGNAAWTAYVPAGVDPKTLQGDSNGDGVPDWAPYVPQTYEDYNQDSNNDGTPDWAPYVPTSWQDLNQDSSGDGIPDWAPYVPTRWQDYNQDTNNDDTPDWAPYVPQGWQDYRGDSNNDGVPDWAPYVPGNWQDYNQDSNGDGIPDWAPYVPAGWQDFNQDTNNDGTPDWAPYVPIQWEDLDQDTNGDGVPDWAPYVPTQWQDYNTDTDSDGTPDWAPYVPTGWEDFDTKDTDYTTDTVTVDNTKTITGVVRFNGSAYDSTEDTTTATYEMPYAPDSYFQILQGQRVLTPGGARVAAEAFGITQSALDIGHAYGQNIVSGFNEIPSDDLSPLYLRVAGIEGAFLCDSVSYAWGPEGMVVSSDLMLLGVTGYYGSSAPATSWLRLPVASTGLTVAGATTVEANPIKANSIVIPNDFSGATPAPTLAQLPVNGQDVFAEWRQGANIIGPTLAVEILTAFTGLYLSNREFEYALTLEAETAELMTGPLIDFVELTRVFVGTASLEIAALVPGVSSGGSALVPVAVNAFSAVAPAVSSGGSIAVPVASIAAAGAAPVYVGRSRLEIQPPTGGVGIAGLAPSVSSGRIIGVPAAVIAVAGAVPTISLVTPDPSFSIVSLLLHMDGSNGSTTFTDSSSSARTVTAYGNAQISTARSKFGGASALFDGSGDYLGTTISGGLGSGDFTVEFWYYKTANSGMVFNCRTSGTGADGFDIDESLGVTTSGAYLITDDYPSRLTLSTWKHVAITRSSNTLRRFVDGTLRGSTTWSTNLTGTSFFIGGSPAGNVGYMTGNIDEFRITKAARYTSNFTPATAAFPNS